MLGRCRPCLSSFGATFGATFSATFSATVGATVGAMPAFGLALVLAVWMGAVPAAAQDAGAAGDDPGPADAAAQRRFDEAFADDDQPDDDEAANPITGGKPQAELNFLDLLLRGGFLMLPIVVMSLIVSVFGIERMLALRRHKVIPGELVDALGEMSSGKGGLDPRKAYKVCQQFPSAAANVIRAAMLKVGRPHAEVEHTVKESCEREAERLYANVRPLMMAAAVSPLLGLLGTVWGMIQAFYQTASGSVQTNKAEQLADGIYTALVTTFAGLAVAIPAAILAHWFEGRIQTLFREIDELLLNMLPQLERYEGKLRIQRKETSPKTGGEPEPSGRSSKAEPERPSDQLASAPE